MEKRRKTLNEQPDLNEQERLVEIMNDTAHLVSFEGTVWEVKALKPGTQWLMCQEAVKVMKPETANMDDVLKQFAVNVPSVAKIITLGLLNDRKKIFKDGDTGAGFSQLYQDTYDNILWNTSQACWMNLLVEMINMLDVEVFFSLIASMEILRQRTLERKVTTEERKLLSPAQSGGR